MKMLGKNGAAEEIREAVRCWDWYRGPRVVSGDANPTTISIMRAEQILLFHVERYARRLEEGDSAHCFWLGKDGEGAWVS